MFLLALFIAIGTTLFSCQDKNGNKNKIDNIEIVGETEKYENETPVCYGHKIESKKQKTRKQFTGAITQGAVVPSNFNEEGTFKYNIIYNSTDLDIAPVPENGMKKFLEFFNQNYVIPKTTEEFKGRGFVVFVVEKDGTLSNFNIFKNTSKEIGEEAIRVLKTAPNWIPGKLNGKIVRSSYILPITIQ